LEGKAVKILPTF